MRKKYLLEIEENKDGSFAWSNFAPYVKPDLEQVRKEVYEVGFNVGRTLINTGKYEKGLNDAWEAARKIWKYDTTTLRAIFGEGIMRMDWFMKFTASEAIEKLKAYEQENEERDGLRQNIQTIVDQCGYTLDEIAAVLREMRGE